MTRNWLIPAIGILVVLLVATTVWLTWPSSPPTRHFASVLPSTTSCQFNGEQTATVTGGPSSGTWTLSVDGSTFNTTPLAINAAASDVLSALTSAPISIPAGEVTVTGSGPYTITFTGSLANSVNRITTANTFDTGSVAVAIVPNDQTNQFQNLVNKQPNNSTLTLPFDSCWEIDGDLPAGTLTTGLTSGTSVTALQVTGSAYDIPANSNIQLASATGKNTQSFTTSSDTPAGMTTIHVNSKTANNMYTTNATVNTVNDVHIHSNTGLTINGNGATLVQTQCQPGDAQGDLPILFLTQDTGLTITNLSIFGAISWQHAGCAGAGANNGPGFEKAAGIITEDETNLTITNIGLFKTQGDGLIFQAAVDFGISGNPLNTNIILSNSTINLGTGGYHCLVEEAVGPTSTYPTGGANIVGNNVQNCPTEFADFEADLVSTIYGSSGCALPQGLCPLNYAEDNTTIANNTIAAWGKPFFASIQAFNNGVQEQNLRITGNILHNTGSGSGPGSLFDIDVTPSCCDSGPGSGSPAGDLTTPLVHNSSTGSTLAVTTSGSATFRTGTLLNVSEGTHIQQFLTNPAVSTVAGSPSISIVSQTANFSYDSSAVISWSIPTPARFWSSGWVIENNTMNDGGAHSTGASPCTGGSPIGQAMAISGLVNSTISNNTLPIDYGNMTGGCPGNPYLPVASLSYTSGVTVTNNNFVGAIQILHGSSNNPGLSHCGNSYGAAGTATLPATETACGPPPTTTTTTTTAPSGGSCTSPVFTSSVPTDTHNTDPSSGEHWWVNNDAWNGSRGPQTIQVCSESSWQALSDQTDNMGQVETYPDSEYDVGGRSMSHSGVNSTTPISAFSAITSTFSEAFPASGWAGDAAYDVWTNNFSGETMYWNDVRGTQTFWSDCAEPGPDFNMCGLAQAPVAVTLDGVAYHFFSYGAKGSNAERVFVRDTPVTSGSVDLLAGWQWEVANGWASASDVPTQIEYGVEICATTGTQTFPVTGLTVNLTPTP